MLITAGDNSDWVRSEVASAKMCGACPIPAGSGKTNGVGTGSTAAGHRQANAALYRAVIVRMRWHQPTIEYVERRTTEGLSKRELSAASSAASPGRSTGCCHRRSPSTATPQRRERAVAGRPRDDPSVSTLPDLRHYVHVHRPAAVLPSVLPQEGTPTAAHPR